MTSRPDWQHETACRLEGYRHICGVDEAGRGPLAGPVVAAAVILPPDCDIEGLNDSKKLSAARRMALRDSVMSVALAYGLGQASVQEIDSLNILQASMLAMRRAMEALPVQADFALIDGSYAKGFDIPVRAVVGGDACCVSIAAASILAKTERDEMMAALDKEYPGYGMAQHKGYGTKAHYAALAALGPTPVHRTSFRLT